MWSLTALGLEGRNSSTLKLRRVKNNILMFLKKSKPRAVESGEKKPVQSSRKRIAIVGSPNVGKSVMFSRLTGTYATVSNYPGTTVEVTRGKIKIGESEFEVIDTPGMYSLFSITEEEKVSRRILLNEKPNIVIHVIDAKNLERMLPLTLQLIEAKMPVLLVLNIIDEAEKIGMKINLHQLEKELKIPVVATASTTGRGMDVLKGRIEEYGGAGVPRAKTVVWDDVPLHQTSTGAARGILTKGIIRDVGDILEISLEKIEGLLQKDYGISNRSMGLLLLQEDEEIIDQVRSREPGNFNRIMEIVQQTKAYYLQPLSYIISQRRQEEASRIVDTSVEHLPEIELSFRERLSRFMIHPVTGVPIMLLIVYYGIYKFVGGFGAGTLVNFIEAHIFEKHVNPWITHLVISIIPWQILRDLFVGEYGIITLGLRYAVALILPIVTTFFIAFAIIEDTGYLPRLALLIDRLFKRIGLTGRAVIPMVLGLGCDTMATMVTRTLPTKRERIISTILLALAVPCSAQLGVILALLGGNYRALWVWAGIIGLVFLLIGFLSSLVLPGDAPSFYMEIPPLRLPKISNVLIKTYTRVQWYFMEIFPMFILASVAIWIGQLSGLFTLLTRTLEYPIRWIGLPEKAAVAFLFGFFRRDYGVAGLYDIKKAGLLSGNQLVVACVTLTLFLPCIAQFLMTVKERGWKTGLAISIFILFFSFSMGFLVNNTLNALRVTL